MGYFLLLYDTTERDLARDFKDLMEELGVETQMIPLAPGRGDTLQEKERRLFVKAQGAVFLVTPGATRHEMSYPSPSVTDEMGMARVLFRDRPASIIYLVDESCEIQSVDQTAHIRFKRDDIRSVVSAVTQLIRELRAGGESISVGESTGSPVADIGVATRRIAPILRSICQEIRRLPGATIGYLALEDLLAKKHGMGRLEIGLTEKDLVHHGLLVYERPSPDLVACWKLTALGQQVAQHESKILT